MAEIDNSQLVAYINDLKNSQGKLPEEIWQVLKEGNLELAHLIKEQIPVWSGRSKASWGIYTQEDLAASPPQGADIKTWVERRNESSPADAIWEEDSSTLKITQGSNVEQVEYLNEGSSTRAPGGFIESNQEAMEERIVEQILELLERAFVGE